MRDVTTRSVSQDPFLPLADSAAGSTGQARHSPPPVQGARIGWGMGLWFVLTLGALLLAWHWPDATLLHFWLVAQAVPVLYWVLIAWVLRAPTREDHVA